MHFQRETPEGSAGIIRALLSGELRVLGNIDGTVRGLFISRAELHQWGRNERARRNSNARMVSEVAKEIGCTHNCIRGLVDRRLLDGWNTPRALLISEQSITKFKNKYVSLALIAREIGSGTTSGLIGYCAAKHIPMIVVPYHGSRQAFVRIKDRNAVLSYRPLRVWNQRRSAERMRRLMEKQQHRLKVLLEVRKGHMTKKQAAVELGVSVTRVCQLLVGWRVGGDSALRLGLGGRPSKRKPSGGGETASRGTMRGEKAGQAANGTAATSADRSALNEDFDAAGQTQAA